MRGFSCAGVGLEKSRFLYCRWRVGVRGIGEKEPKLGPSGEDEGGCKVFEKRGGEVEMANMAFIVRYQSLVGDGRGDGRGLAFLNASVAGL